VFGAGEADLMCNRARLRSEPETLLSRFGANWWPDTVRPNADPQELYPKAKAYVLREHRDRPALDVMTWDVLGGKAPWPVTNVRNLGLPQWRALAASPAQRCLVPLTEFCEWTPDKHQVGAGAPVKGEMWFACTDQPVLAIAGFWQETAKGPGFAMVTCDPNPLVAPIHPKAMITILEAADWERWLAGSYDDVVALQRPYPAERMTVRGPVFPTRIASSAA
jgi:putative SOS response-associated peptidase YedK